MTTPTEEDPVDRITELETALTAALDRITEVEAQLHHLSGSAGGPKPSTMTSTAGPETTPHRLDAAVIRETDDDTDPEVDLPNLVDRRRLLTRAGTAAVGAVLGGAAATIATAGPAAAATGSFDTATSTPALTTSTSGSGPSISAASTSTGRALDVSGQSQMAATSGTALTVQATGTGNAMTVQSDNNGMLLVTDGVGIWSNSGSIAFEGLGEDLGALLGGRQAQLYLVQEPNPGDIFYMEPPRSLAGVHERGEIYFDTNSDLWVNVQAGTPGTWVRVAGQGGAGIFSALPTPVRVFDSRPGSGKPGAGTGPISGTRHGIALTANSSGLPVDASAAMVTMTVTNTQANPAAYGQIYPDALVTPPATSVINWTAANTVIATTTTTGLTNGKVAVTIAPGANVILDLIGYWR